MGIHSINELNTEHIHYNCYFNKTSAKGSEAFVIKNQKLTRMKYTIFLIVFYFILNPSLLWAQFCTLDNRFTEVEYFSSSEIASNTNVTYATNVLDWQGVSQDLEMDVYYPSGPNETLSARPFILLIHGGGFQSGSKSIMTADCISFARRGYVAATINYRLGWDTSDPLNQIIAAYRAQQDAHAALRFLVENAGLVDVDTNWLFIGGRSAGAVTALNMVYADQQDWEIAVPGIEANLGSLESSGNSLMHTFTLNGILNNWGSTPAFAIEPDEMLPTISFHGALDTTVPIDSSSANGFAGSGYIHNVLVNSGICSEMTVDSLGGHGIYTNSSGSEFRVERASCFFKSIFCDNCSSTYLTDAVDPNCSIGIPQSHDVFLDATCIQLKPNPVQDLYTIAGLLGSYQIEILSSTGSILQVVYSTSSSYTFNVSNFPQGLYFVRIANLTNNSILVEKIIKE